MENLTEMQAKIYIKEILKSKGITYREFSDMVGTTPANISAIANGRMKPKMQTLEKWAESLAVTITELVGSKSSEPEIVCPCCGAKFILAKK